MMLFGNDDQNEGGSIQASSDTDLDYLYGPAPERPLFTSLARERGRGENSAARQDQPVEQGQAIEHEGQVETLSGFLLVLKGTGDKAVLSVRRKVGTPPNNSVVLNSEELRRLANVLSEMMPAPASRELLNVGAARLSDSELGLETFIEREYPALAKRRKKPQSTGSKKKIIAAVAVLLVVISGCVLIGTLNSKPFAKVAQDSANASDPENNQEQVRAKVENLARNFVTDMLDFKSDTYRQSQIRALAMMSDELSGRYWQETHFPLTRQQLRKMPAQDLTIDSVKSVLTAGNNYAVDVQGQLKTNSNPIPILIRLSIQVDGDKFQVTDQKDLSASLSQGTTKPAQ